MPSAWGSLGLIVLTATSCGFPQLPALGDGGADGDGNGDGGPFQLELLAGDIGGPGNADGMAADARFTVPSSVGVDSAGNVYVADQQNHTIRKVSVAGIVTTLAGTAGSRGGTDGKGAAARFHNPSGLTVDRAGNIYVTEQFNHTLRKITGDGTVTTLAGTAGMAGAVDGTGAAARFRSPLGVTVDGLGNLYVADLLNDMIRKVSPSGVVTTLAGSVLRHGSEDGPAASASFAFPSGVARDGRGDVYVTDSGNHTLRKITPDGVVTTVAGTAGMTGSTDGVGANARFSNPSGVAIVGLGVYVIDSDNSTIREVSSTGVVRTVAGTARVRGSADGPHDAARFNLPSGMAVDNAGNIYVADRFNHTIRKLTGGEVTTVAGAATKDGSADGTRGAARFDFPTSVAVDSARNIYVADTSNATIRKITATGVVTTLAGTAKLRGGEDGTGTNARFNSPTGVAVDGTGNLYVVDTFNHNVRKITAAGVVTTLAGSAGMDGNTDGAGGDARFTFPAGAAVDVAGDVYIADRDNHTIRKITAGGVVTTLAGTPGMPGSVDGTGAAARFDRPVAAAVDGAGNVYVAEQNNHAIRKISATGIVTTLAGSPGMPGSADGAAADARFHSPRDVTVDSAGNVYVADTGNQAIRKITPDGTTTTIAGKAGSIGILLGETPRFAFPQSLAIVGDSLVIVDTNAILLLRAGAR